MPYVLGIDVGTSRTRAAVCRNAPAGWSDPVPVPLGTRHPGVPTVVRLAADRSALVGDEADRQAGADPIRVARGFPGRIGDDVPLVLGGTPCTAQELTAVLIRWVVDRAAEQEGGPADALVVTHPARWGGHRKSLLHHELVRQGLERVTLVAAPTAIAETHPADVVATYTLGEGPAEVAVVRRTAAGTFELLADAEGAEPVGGGHFDDAVLACVRDQVGRALDHLDPADPQAWVAMARLRAMCTGAKEMLSTEAEVIVPVRLPDAPSDVRVSRADFERAVRPAVAASVDLLPRTLRAAGVDAADATVVLAGGSVRVPLVAELVRATVPAFCPAEPDAVVAAGAAVTARKLITGPDRAVAQREVVPHTEVIQRSAIAAYAGERAMDPDDVVARFGAEPPARPAVDVIPIDLPEPSLVPRLLSSVRPAALTASTIALAAVGIVLTFVLESGSGNHSAPNPLHLGPAAPPATTAASP
ncbi:MAG TPA: Hsp70 family protein [Pseudonocardiaceae bacterium]|jgi:molecular chaperone DnaK (HSP70)|nr:Hsp70 family protein [Pseudonocardiaceae bacterium]